MVIKKINYNFLGLFATHFQSNIQAWYKNSNRPNTQKLIHTCVYSDMRLSNNLIISHNRAFSLTFESEEFSPLNLGPGYNWHFFFQRWEYIITNVILFKLHNMMVEEKSEEEYERIVRLALIYTDWDLELYSAQEIIAEFTQYIKPIPKHKTQAAREAFIRKHDMRVFEVLKEMTKDRMTKQSKRHKMEHEFILKEIIRRQSMGVYSEVVKSIVYHSDAAV